ncbi:MAG: hypothetical protein PHH13_00950 [Candidatus Peribacteraceae bacterium]|nr:hypothetical protein [Candidatus Peribacteraceae bacterium]
MIPSRFSFGLRSRLWALSLMIGLTIIGGSVAYASRSATALPVLAACTRFEGELFKDIDFKSLHDTPKLNTANVLDEWSNSYHSTVSKIIEEDLGELVLDSSPLRSPSRSPRCTATNYAGFLTPRSELKSLAKKLPSWKNSTNLSRLNQLDMGTVLLEYLRMYECALVERLNLLPAYILRQEAYRQWVLFGLSVPKVVIEIPILGGMDDDERFRIRKELVTARAALLKTLTFVSGYNRLQPIDMELICVQRASLDIRNGLALAADAASCLPRVWNAKEPLRDFENE